MNSADGLHWAAQHPWSGFLPMMAMIFFPLWASLMYWLVCDLRNGGPKYRKLRRQFIKENISFTEMKPGEGEWTKITWIFRASCPRAYQYSQGYWRVENSNVQLPLSLSAIVGTVNGKHSECKTVSAWVRSGNIEELQKYFWPVREGDHVVTLESSPNEFGEDVFCCREMIPTVSVRYEAR